ncbi:MAG: MFS transporter [Saprospiraceae bacterium]|nr:MFS transporter [Saprospiraceae bacterium]
MSTKNQNVFERYLNSFSGLSKEIWMLALVTLINRSGTMVIPFLTIFLTDELDFTIGQAGAVMSAFGLGSVVGTFIGGQLTDKIGYYKVMFSTLFATGVVFILLQFFHGYWMWMAAIFVTSTIADGFRPASMTAIAAYSKPENRTRSVTLIRLAINTGWAIGPAIAGILAKYVGYEWLFWGDGLTCIGAAILLTFVLSPKKTQGKENKEESDERALVDSVYADRKFLAFVVLVSISAIAFFQLFSMIPLYFKEGLALGEDVIGYLLGFNGVLIAIIEMPIVFSFEKRFHALRLTAIGTFLIGTTFLVLNMGSWMGFIILAIILITIGEIFSMPFSNAFTMARSSSSNRGSYMAVYGMAYSMAFIAAPSLGAWISSQYGWSTLWYVVLGLCILGSIGFMILNTVIQNEKRAKEASSLAQAEG